jgi:hypothetical protein
MAFGVLRRRWVLWRESGADYRKERRQWVGAELQRLRLRWSLVPAAILAVAGPIVVWVYGRISGIDTDVVSLALAAVVPFVVVVAGAWGWYRMKAPNALFKKYKDFYVQRTPPPPFAATGQIGSSGITFELLPASYSLPPPDVAVAVNDGLTAHVVLDHHIASLKQALSPGALSRRSTVTVRYPDDFDHAEWPVRPGKYEMVWSYTMPDGSSGSLGWQFRIPRRSL